LENKDFIIPKNVNSQFELIPNVGLKDMVFFLPSIVIDIPMIMFVPASPILKIILCSVSFFIPFCLVFIRPLRENIPAWKQLVWAFQFKNRQKRFEHRKKVDNIVFTKK
jgi:hypothetical protein